MSAKHVRAREPDLTRKGPLGHPRTILLAIVAVIFTAYVLGYLPQLDSLFGSAVENSRNHGLLIVGPIVLLIVGLFVLFILLLIFGFLGNLLTSFSRTVTFFGRSHTTLDEFTKLAQAQGIPARVAKETYELLRPHYPRKMCIALEDELRKHLILKDESIRYLQSKLLNRCDRREVLSFSVASLQTVFDLMQHVEGAPPQHVSGTLLRRRNIDLNPEAIGQRRVEQRRGTYRDVAVAGTDKRLNPSDRRSIARRDGDGAQEPPQQEQPASFHSDVEITATPSDAQIRMDRRAPIVDSLPPAAPIVKRQGDDPNYLPPRRREYSGMFRRVTDTAAPAPAPGASQPSSLDDPDFRPRTRPDYSGILRRASDIAPSGEENPALSQSAVRRRFGDTGLRPRAASATPPGTVPSTGTADDNVFIPPRRISDTGFRRRSADPPAIKPDSEEK